ncbi:MAG: valine--tRNA ligase [Acidimicrobiia bacterium]|nr:valine--tRNA ligase [Acidimicrobiia bacterium]
MEPTYDPKQVEARWYPVWEQAGAFRPEINPDGAPFSIVIPPPNVTGVLHMGHALNMSLQDVIVRRKRMQGFAVLWLPGTDHAGIATQNVVERELAAEGLTRHDLGREAFVERVWAWKAASGGRITDQIRRMGFSTDWTRERFTLDAGLSVAVREVFVSLYEDGVIYRGRRIINWCPRCRTALSDIEVEHEDTVGGLVSIRYPLADDTDAAPGGGIVVATTRAETMLGDTGVAVHPDDDRYRHLVGRTVVLPLLGRVIPIVADEAVDPAFGTGAVKVTPAHDPLDFDIASRHGLDPVVVIDEAGTITAAGGAFAGMDRMAARAAVKAALTEQGLLVGVEEHRHAVGHCSRCRTVVEPLLSLQWFVAMTPLVGPAIEAVTGGASRFVPARWRNVYVPWMENLRDWCISRQLWWGHRIPAWYCDACDETIVSRHDVTACPSCGGAVRAEEDVLDTWFSSALWPFSTLGWPEKTNDLARYYPTDVLVTGFDIITFWVSRMLMTGMRFMGDKPFSDIVIHGLVRAADGRKMSKSAGNALDPLDLADRYGADAVRLALVRSAAPGHDIPLNEDWIDAGRRFGNKLWNAVRFAVEHASVGLVPATGGYPTDPGPEDAWILGRLAQVAAAYDTQLDQYRFSDAATTLYNFAWSEVFDWYLEMAKPLLAGDGAATTRATLGVVLRDLLSLLHPIVPHVTEELWAELGDGSLLITARWPEPPAVAAPDGMAELHGIVTELRRFRADHALGGRHLDVRLDAPGGLAAPWWRSQLAALGRVTVIEGVGGTDGIGGDGGGSARLIAGRVSVHVPMAGVVDLAVERPRLERAIADSEALLAASEQTLANPAFRERAPAAVVAKEEAKRAEFVAAIDRLRSQLAGIG